MGQAVRETSSYVKKQKLSGQVLKKVKGWLRKSIKTSIATIGDRVQGRVFTTWFYALVHEMGKTLRAKKGALAIPTAEAYKKSGQQRPKPKDFPYSFVAPVKGGGAVIYGKKTPGEEFALLFILQQQVRIPARPFMAPALQERKDAIIKTIGYAAASACQVGNS